MLAMGAYRKLADTYARRAIVTTTKGDWIQTFTERQFWPLDPRPEHVVIEDIAHALSMTCRYGGHCKKFYSVAEHSVLVAQAVRTMGGDTTEQFMALLHDAGEAYLCDLPRPVKPWIEGFKAMEDRIEDVIAIAFGLETLRKTPRIAEADLRILVDETAAVMGTESMDWHRQIGKPLNVDVQGLNPAEAERWFLQAFSEIGAAAGFSQENK